MFNIIKLKQFLIEFKKQWYNLAKSYILNNFFT